MKNMIAILILALFLVGCSEKVEQPNDEAQEIVTRIAEYEDPLFCQQDSDCKLYWVKGPCDVIEVANIYADIQKDSRDYGIGASQEFCEWSYKKAVCRGNGCVAELNCERMAGDLKDSELACSEVEDRFGDPQGNSNYRYWSQFCQLYESC